MPVVNTYRVVVFVETVHKSLFKYEKKHFNMLRPMKAPLLNRY